MFKVPAGYALAQSVQQAEKNYLIQKNDRLKLEVFSNDGERIIDPDGHLAETIPANVAVKEEEEADYLVDIHGNVKLPMIGEIRLDGLTIRQAEAVLQKDYEKYYNKPFVRLKNNAKRVIVLGAPGGLVIPLPYDNMELVEIIAQAQGIKNDGKASNIRVIRDDDVFLIDFQTIEGFKKGNMIMEPGDIVYIEPIRKPVSEAFRDYGPILSVLTTLTTLIVVITSK